MSGYTTPTITKTTGSEQLGAARVLVIGSYFIWRTGRESRLTESDNCVTELAAAFLQLGRSAAVTYVCIAFGMSIFLKSLNAARSIVLHSPWQTQKDGRPKPILFPFNLRLRMLFPAIGAASPVVNKLSYSCKSSWEATEALRSHASGCQ
jgi:hypothetical protein